MEPNQQSPRVEKSQLVVICVLLIALSGFAGWKASEYAGAYRRATEQVNILKAEVAALTKENEQLKERLQSWQPGWRPGTPIGTPAGNAPAGNPPK